MKTANELRTRLRSGRLLVPAFGMLVLAACSGRSSVEMPAPQRLSAEVRAILGMTWPSAEYHRERLRLQEMGPELDVALVGLIEDTRARTEARADALLLLADRRSPLALITLERALQYDNERLRSAAVLGLSRLAPTEEVAVDLIRRATTDRSRTVRLNALQSLDVQEVGTIRRVLLRENDPEVRQVGLQLALLAESRGAPLAMDSRGALRTMAREGEPQIVFRPVEWDTVAQVARGDLRLELTEGPDLPLAGSALVVGNVAPAFLSADRSAVVAEVEGEIRVFDVSSRTSWTLGEGIAPRSIPFTQHFIFLREVEPGATSFGVNGERVLYQVFRAPFGAGSVDLMGVLTAYRRDDQFGGESPVRSMVLGDAAEGLVLRGKSVEPFYLPPPPWVPARSNGVFPGRAP